MLKVETNERMKEYFEIEWEQDIYWMSLKRSEGDVVVGVVLSSRSEQYNWERTSAQCSLSDRRS